MEDSSPQFIKTPTNLRKQPDLVAQSNSYQWSDVPNKLCPVSFQIHLSDVEPELVDGLVEVAKYCPHNNIVIVDIPYFHKVQKSKQFRDALFIWELQFIKDESLARGKYWVQEVAKDLELNKLKVQVKYHRKIEAFKALGKLLSLAFQTRRLATPNLSKKPYENLLHLEAQAQFDTLCFMIDCSRNAVPSWKTILEYLRYCALFGYNMVQLYTEDTFKVKDEPYFGFNRGGYTEEELVKIDDYAFDLGIELVPCIQTLGHLGQILQWPAYREYRDTSEVLSTRSEKTYQLIEKLILTVSQPLRSNKIHIGMDECFNLGGGNTRPEFAHEDSATIYIRHLDRVREICKRVGLQPMIWSDMLFTLVAKGANRMGVNGSYNANLPPIPFTANPLDSNELELVYWDYYHLDPEVYRTHIRRHIEPYQSVPWVAGGCWTWSRFWCAHQFSFKSVQASLNASKAKPDGVNQYMLTVWGDDGSECDYFSALPTMAYASELAYTTESSVDIGRVRDCFAGCCGGSLQAWYDASQLDELPFDSNFSDLATIQSVDLFGKLPNNPSKHLLWEDPFYSILSPSYAQYDLETHYSQLSLNLLKSVEENLDLYPLNHRLYLPIYLAQVLSQKVFLKETLAELYNRNAKEELLATTTQRFKDLKFALTRLWHYHRSLWYHDNQPFGWEVLELRYGGLMARFDTMASRITDYCAYQLKQVHRLTPCQLLPTDDAPMEEVPSRSSGTDMGTPTAPVSSPRFIDDTPNETHPNSTQPLIFDLEELKLPNTHQFSIWPQHAHHTDHSRNQLLERIPEFEVEVLDTFPIHLNSFFSYAQASSVSRIG